MDRPGEVPGRRHLRSRDEKVWEIVKKWYEPHRHDRCKRWIWRHVLYRALPMSERSFYRSLERHRRRLEQEENSNRMEE